MITGFNTDVKHGSRVYHVQTEDKGRNNPKIESLVYSGGEILDNFRTTYDNADTLSEDEIMELIETQHKRVIRTIKMGKYDDFESFPEELISNRSLDEVISEYLQQEKPTEGIKLQVNEEKFAHGEEMPIQIHLSKMVEGTPLSGYYVRVKLISTRNKPVVLSQGSTGQDGNYAASIAIPPRAEGESAIVLQVSGEIGTLEKRIPLR